MAYSVIIPVLYLASGTYIFLLGLTILRIGRSGGPTRATALMLFFAGIGPLLTATGLILESNLKAGAIVHQNMLQNFEYLWEFYFPSLMLFALSFPREHPLLRRLPLVAFIVFLPYLVHLGIMMSGNRLLDFVAQLYKVFPADRSVSLGAREIAAGTFDGLINVLVRILERVHRTLFAIVNITYSLAALWLLWSSLRRVVNPRIARQLRTVGAGLTVSVVCYTATKLTAMFDKTPVSEDMSLALINFSLVASGGTIAYAVMRQQFLGIRNVVRRSLLYSGVALLYAFLYLVVARPISDFFAQYSSVGKDAFEAGFIVVTIIAFQPTLIRTEEILERVLLRGRVDVTRRFRRLGEAVAGVTTIEELQNVLRRGFREELDASIVQLELERNKAEANPLLSVLEEIAEPVRHADILRLRDERYARRRGRFLRGWFSVDKRALPPSSLDRLFQSGSEYREYDVYIPLLKDQKCVGYVGLGEKIYGVPYTSEELARLSVLSTQVTSSLGNIRLLKANLERKLLEEELKIARKIQTQLLPSAPPVLRGYELCAVTVPSRYVGGDYYDFVLVDDNYLLIVVADVSGKGIPASILTATLQAAVHSNVDAHANPGLMMRRLNNLLFRNTSAAEFATLFYAVVELQTGLVRYTNAGHDFPFVSGSGRAEQLTESGIVLGCMKDFAYIESEFEIPRSGALVVYTDGVTDSQAVGGEYYGTERLKSALEQRTGLGAEQMCAELIADVRKFGTGESQDDLTMLVLRRAD